MNSPIEILKDLVTINSINPKCQPDGPGEAECARYVSALLKKKGIDFELQEVFPGRHNVVARLDGRDKSKKLVFEAHMDTVAITGMTIPPFDPVIQGDRLYGRGSCDTKCSLAAMLAALIATKDNPSRAASLVLVATVDEENAFSGVVRFCKDCGSAGGAIVGEATDLDAVIAHKSAVRWRTTIHGRACHTSRPDLGKNAISQAVKLIGMVERDWLPKVRARTHPLLERGEMTVSLIGGGTQINFVPDTCWFEIDRRTLPGEERQTVLAEFQGYLDAMKKDDPDFRYSIEMTMPDDWAMETKPNERIVQVAHAASKTVKPAAKICGAPYGTDASKLSRAGIPSVVLGPGNIAQAHTADEWVSVRQVEQAAEVYREIMEKF
jgi:acetylornithine deacetylase